jgi:hypothetical protein
VRAIAHRISRRGFSQIKAWRDGQGPEPIVTIDTLPDTVNNIIGTWLAKAIGYSGVEFYGLAVMFNHPQAGSKFCRKRRATDASLA